MKKYVKPTIARKVVLSEVSLLLGSIVEGELTDGPGEGNPDNPVILEAPQIKNYNVWE